MLTTQALRFADLLDRRYLKSEYQPIVDLLNGDQVGVEALARWPALGVTPGQAFGWATELNRLGELDAACCRAALDGALDNGFPEALGLFVNIEPSTLMPDTATRLLRIVRGRARVVFEITERALLRRPADLLAAVRALREGGCSIALDDVGTAPESLALLPLLAPDVVKLDISLVQQKPDVAHAQIVSAVASYAERTGAAVVAEGIETEEHRQQALALGATLGQGWLFGKPGPIERPPAPRRPLRVGLPMPPAPATPCELIDLRSARVASKELLLGMSQHLENQVFQHHPAPVVMSTFEDAANFGERVARRYGLIAGRCPLVSVMAGGLRNTTGGAIRGTALLPSDPLRREWVVVVVGVHFSGALIAKDLGDGGRDRDRRFAFVLTHDRDVVLGAARSLLARISPI